MKPGAKFAINLMCWVWFALFAVGLNGSLEFVSLGLLLYAMIFFFLVDLVFPRMGIIFKLLVVLVLVHRTFYIGSFFSPRWLQWFAADIGKDLGAVPVKGLNSLLPVTVFSLYLFGFIAVQNLYTFLISRGKAAMFLLFAGTALLTGAYLWTGKGSVLMVVVYAMFGLVMMGTAKVQMSTAFPLQRWVGTLMVWVLIISSIAWAMPDGDLNLGNWLERALTWNYFDPDAPPRGRVGYSSYDGIMGGALEEDNTPALQMQAPVPVYLRGEIRSNYTGTSWLTPFKAIQDNPQYVSSALAGREVTVKLTVLSRQGEVVFAPRYPRNFQFDTDSTVIVSSPAAGAGDPDFAYEEFEFNSSLELKAGDTYTISALLPLDDPKVLRELSNQDPGDQRYLQLYDDLPERVKDLALSVTAEAENGYDKAMALVQHLRYGKWDYSLETQAPPQGHDFVDWFLFEQNRGYCVHFSTAFVILARAAGLPSRWVKGYSYGTRDEWGNFIILNSNAHSWPEVWFDGYGWVPFEPTPGAVLPTLVEDTNDPDEGGPNNPPVPGDPDQPGHDPADDSGSTPVEPESQSWIWAIGLLGVLGAALFLFIRSRAFATATVLYARLQSRLRLFGWQRHRWETAREHLNRVKDLPDKPVLTDFVQQFEAEVYGGALEKSTPEQSSLRRRFSVLRLAWHRLTSRY